MCGIVAYTGRNDSSDIIIGGLKKLEYRGYDSAGIARQNKDGKITTTRAVGKVKNLEAKLQNDAFTAYCAIGHTRWATHGKPCEENSHPHSDCTGQISLVHNGIIENYAQLKEELIAKGHKFLSQTDSEVIAHLIEENLKTSPNFEAAFTKTVKQLTGAYAVVAMYAKEPAVLYAAKQHSPLVLGIADDGVYAASDVPAFLAYTNKAVFLEDGDIARLTPEGFSVNNIEEGPAERKITEISWDAKTAEKGGFDHFMLKEIFDQPQALEDTLLTLPPDLEKSFGITLQEAAKIKGFYLVACGTAYHAALCAKYFLEHFTKLPVEVETASEFKYRTVPFQKDWLFMAISQSGETADTLSALKNAKAAGLKVMSVCNVLGATITRESDFTVYTHCGPEISVASTKAFTSQLGVLYSFAINFARAVNALGAAEFDALYKELHDLPVFVKQTLKLQDTVKDWAKKIYQKRDFIFIGRNVCYPVALEGALKLKEISYLHAEGFSGGEIKHGPIAVLEEGLPVIALAPKDELFEKMLSNCQEAAARGADIKIVTNTALDNAIVVPYTTRYLFAILAVIPLQFFAYYISVLNGREIDHPRNLAKSVTVE